MGRRTKTVFRYSWIMFGLFLMSNGIVCLVRAQLGVSPWDVLHLGISYQTGISLGRVLQGVGLLVIAISYLFKVKPSFITLLNMFFVGYFVDLISSFSYIPQPTHLTARMFLYLGGVAVCGLGTALYISGNRGAGPRDSLMLALTRITSKRMGLIRTAMEVTVATTGYFLGGPLGIGTLLFALTVGFFIEVGFALIQMLKRSSLYRIWWEEVREMPAA